MGVEDAAGAFLDLGYVSKAISVGTTQVEAFGGASVRLVNRQYVLVYNNDTTPVYFGPTGVTSSGTTKGVPLQPKQSVSMTIGDQGLFLIAASGTVSCIVQEWS